MNFVQTKIEFNLMRSGEKFHHFNMPVSPLTKDDVQSYWVRLPVVPPDGLPLHYTLDERVIGRITNFEYHDSETEAFISASAAIEDLDLLQTPGLKFEQIARAAILKEYD